MRFFSRFFSAVFIIFLLSVVVNGEEIPKTRFYIESSKTEADLEYYREAAILEDLIKVPVTTKVVVKMLKAIDFNLPKFFPSGPFTRNDFIALAWTESAFHQYEGGTHGERGLFQIMPDEFSSYHITRNFYDIDVNTKMAFRVLKGKYKKWNDYKRAIIAYNGVVILKKGKNKGRWSEKYWRIFHKRKVAVDSVLNKNND